MISEAFFEICQEAEPASPRYVSLYISAPFYGGPEEGGWWGQDVTLIASQRFETEDQAEAAKTRVGALAADLNREAKDSFGEYCLRQMEWLEARGLDADYLPEVDGSEEYFVCIETNPGSQAHHGNRHYE